MNKKFLSAILFGALMVSSTGTFVSCKDYDDDIKDLQSQIDKKASIEDLKTQVSAIETSLADAKSALNAAKTTAEAAKADAEKALNEAKKAGDTAAQAAAEAKAAAAEVELKAAEAKEAAIAAAEAKVKELKKEIEDSVGASLEKIQEIAAKVEAATAEAMKIVGNKLQSLVLQVPENLYVGGVEAVEYEWMIYDFWDKNETAVHPAGLQDHHASVVKVLDAAKELNFLIPADGDELKEKKVYSPEKTVTYHKNPKSAKVDKLADLSITSGDVQYIARAASQAGFEVTGMDQNTFGELKVNFKATGADGVSNHGLFNGGKHYTPVIKDKQLSESTLCEQDGENKVAVFALNALVEGVVSDTTITSDYAMLYESHIIPRAIAYNDATLEAEDCTETTGNPDELYKSVYDAIQKAPTINVPYNGEKDLKELLTIHYDWFTETNNAGKHKVMTYADAAHYGMKFEFARVNYEVGVNRTQDSKYCDATKLANGIVAPRNVDASGNTLTTQHVASVGRCPLIRVLVKDEAGEIILYGFVKLQITQEIGWLETAPFNKTFNFGCNGGKQDLTWSEISHELLTLVAKSSKNDFDLLYKMDMYTATPDEAIQYAAAGAETGRTNKIGTIKESYDNTVGTTTNVPSLSFTMDELQEIYELPNHQYTTWIRYVSRSGDLMNIPVYLKLVVTVAKPQGTVTKKIAEYWKYDNGNGHGLYVLAPRDGQNSRNFVRDLDIIWETNKPDFGAPATGFASYTTATFAKEAVADPTGGYKYYFTEENQGAEIPGTNYKWYVDQTTVTCKIGGSTTDFATDHIASTLLHALDAQKGVFTNTKLYASNNGGVTKVLIAVIDQATGNITYQDNATAKYLLNLYGHTDPKLVAKVGVCAYNECDVVFSTMNDRWNARFLRPVDITPGAVKHFQDAATNDSKVAIMDMYKFNDYRHVDNKPSSDPENTLFVKDDNTNKYKDVWFFAYYNFNKITVDFEGMTTNMNGNDINTKKLYDVNPALRGKFTYSGSTQVGTTEVYAKTLSLSTYNNAVSGTQTTYDAIKSAMGEVVYSGTGDAVNTYTIRIPVTFTYDWGDLKTTVDCTVGTTLGN